MLSPASHRRVPGVPGQQ